MDNNIIEKIDYLVLLRGINVGGKNIVKMDLLKKLFEEMGFMDVKTYIQSGNILVKSSEKDKTKLVNNIEEVLFDKLNYKINIIILTLSEIKNIVNNIPNKFGEENEKYKYDVIFLIEPLSKHEFKKELKTNIAGDEITEGEKVFYIKRLIEKLSGSYLTKIIKTPMWQNISIRNFNTIKKLYELMNTKELANEENGNPIDGNS